MRAAGTYLKQNALAVIALFIALGGTGYAAASIPHNSVGTRQLRNGAVTPAKLNAKEIGGSVRAWAYVSATGHEYAGHGFNRIVAGKGSVADVYSLRVTNRKLRGCAVSASIIRDIHATASDVGYAVGELPSVSPKSPYIGVDTYNGAGQPAPLPFVVQILC